MLKYLEHIFIYFNDVTAHLHTFSGNGNEVHNVGDSACPVPCSDIDPGEHCDETTGKCVCGAPGSPSCIGNKDKPYCYHGKCEGNFYND